VSTVVVILNVVEEKQRHFTMHNEEIQCMVKHQRPVFKGGWSPIFL
jgi:hypothetical protein